MNSVKRYSNNDWPFVECDDGQFVLYSDYADLREQVKAAQRVLDEKNCNVTCQGDDDCHTNSCKLERVLYPHDQDETPTPNVIEHIEYECPVCGAIYQNKDAAEMCASQPKPDDGGIKPGDIVFCSSGFGWFDGDPKWVSNLADVEEAKRTGRKCPNGNGNCFDYCCTYRFYYVVGAVEIERTHSALYMLGKSPSGEEVSEHRILYHVFTRAMKPETGYSQGYTHDQGHITPELLRPQPVLPGAAEFIGRRTERLL